MVRESIANLRGLVTSVCGYDLHLPAPPQKCVDGTGAISGHLRMLWALTIERASLSKNRNYSSRFKLLVSGYIAEA